MIRFNCTQVIGEYLEDHPTVLVVVINEPGERICQHSAAYPIYK